MNVSCQSTSLLISVSCDVVLLFCAGFTSHEISCHKWSSTVPAKSPQEVSSNCRNYKYVLFSLLIIVNRLAVCFCLCSLLIGVIALAC